MPWQIGKLKIINALTICTLKIINILTICTLKIIHALTICTFQGPERGTEDWHRTAEGTIGPGGGRKHRQDSAYNGRVTASHTEPTTPRTQVRHIHIVWDYKA